MDAVNAAPVAEKNPARTSGDPVQTSDAASLHSSPKANVQRGGGSFSGSKRKQMNRPKFVDQEQASYTTDIDPNEYEVRKFMPPSMPRRYNDVFITIKTCFEAQLKRCIRLLDEPRTNEIWLHGIGLGVSRAVNLALRLEHHYYPAVHSDPKTETVNVTDTLFPLRDELDPMTRDRRLSAVHIRVFFAMPKSCQPPVEPKAARDKSGPPVHITKEKQKARKVADARSQAPDNLQQATSSKAKGDVSRPLMADTDVDARERPTASEAKTQPVKDRKKLPPGVTASATHAKKSK